MSKESSLRKLLEDEPIDSYMHLAIQKAETQRQIRDKLQGFKNLKYESPEKRMHFQMLGRVGYDRLDIPDITNVENQKAKGSFKLNESIRNNASLFSIKETFLNTIKPIEFISWLTPEMRQELIAVLLTELATRWYIIQQRLPRNADPTKNARFIAVLFSKIQEKLTSIILRSENKFTKWKTNKIFTEVDNEGRLKSYFRLQIRTQYQHHTLDKCRINIDNLIESLLQTRTRYILHKYHNDPPPLSLEEQSRQQINQAADQTAFYLKDLSTTIKKNFKVQSKRLTFESELGSRDGIKVNAKGARKLEELMEESDGQYEVSSCSEEEYVDNVGAFEFRFDANALLNPLLCANITRKRFTDDIVEELEFDVVAVKAKRYLYSDASLKDPYLLTTKDNMKLAESMKSLRSISVLSTNAQISGLLHDESLHSDLDRGRLRSSASIKDSQGVNYELDPLFVDTEVSAGLSLPIAVSMASDRVPKDLIKLTLLPSTVDVYEQNGAERTYFDIKDSSISDAAHIKEIYDAYFFTFNRSGFEADTDGVRYMGCPAAPKSVEHMVSSSRGKSASSFTADYLVMKKTDYENKLSAKSIAVSSKSSKELQKDYRRANKYNFGGYVAHTSSKKQTFNDDEAVAIHDYLTYLNEGEWDFLLHVIIDERAESINKQKQFEEFEKQENEKAKKMVKDQVTADKYERRRAMTEFVPGTWNLGVLNMIEEVNARDVIRVGLLKRSKEHRASMTLLEHKGRSTSKSKQLVQSTTSTNSSTVDPQAVGVLNINARTDSMTDLVVIQRDLEEIWDTLKMPLDMRVEMAIKYSSTTSGIRSELAAEMWKIAVGYVVKREAILLRIEEWERRNSDPKRFFAVGYAGSSNARFVEADERGALLFELKEVDQLLGEAMDRIERTQHEIVTYGGTPMHVKISNDYISIMKRIQAERREKAVHERRGSASH